MSIQRRGVSKAEWLEAGLEALRNESVSAITIERLARSLGIAKSGFYWHFENREDLLRQMLDHWVHELTEVVTGNVQLIELDPQARIVAIAEMIVEHDLAGLDLAIRQWALQDREAARAVRRVNKLRLEFIGRAFAELGFEGDEVDVRAMVFVGYHALEPFVFPEISRKRRRELLAARIELLTTR